VIDCIIVKAKKDHIMAIPVRVISIEPERSDATPLCPHYSNPLNVVPDGEIHKNGCGGCKRQLLSYAKQLELKAHLVDDSFRSVSYLLEQTPLQQIIPSPLTYQYRNKIEFSFGKYITKAKNDRKAKAQKDGLSRSEIKNVVESSQINDSSL
jgi:tRNA/tmRNA/rRNA uracil-C5-methylase (TrmA/RlmC/RlmD family)